MPFWGQFFLMVKNVAEKAVLNQLVLHLSAKSGWGSAPFTESTRRIVVRLPSVAPKQSGVLKILWKGTYPPYLQHFVLFFFFFIFFTIFFSFSLTWDHMGGQFSTTSPLKVHIIFTRRNHAYPRGGGGGFSKNYEISNFGFWPNFFCFS